MPMKAISLGSNPRTKDKVLVDKKKEMEMNTKLKQIATVVHTMVQTANTVDHKVLARAIGTVIFDIPTTKSGLVSQGLLCEYGYRPAINKCTEEHFHSRNESGYQIIELLTHGGSYDDLVEFLKEVTTVHLTTKEENIKLSSIQNHPMSKDLPWETQYEMAGIELVEDPGCMPPKMKNKLKKGEL